jgi:SlyX protein
MEDRLEILETRLAYQDQTVEALNEVVTRQQDQIDRLEKSLQALEDLYRELQGRRPRPVPSANSPESGLGS